jgi:hypothetical protein
MNRKNRKKFKSSGYFLPDEFLDEVLPVKTWKKRFVTGPVDDLKVKQSIIKTLVVAGVINKKELTATITNVLTGYKARAHKLEKVGVRAYKAEAINNEALLKQRVKDTLVYAQVQTEKKEHAGQYYRWLPSSAINPDFEHQSLYGEIFRVGQGDKDGNMPGERFGCQCGIEWLEQET